VTAPRPPTLLNRDRSIFAKYAPRRDRCRSWWTANAKSRVGTWESVSGYIFESRNGAFAARRRAFRLHAIRKALIKRRRLVASPPVQTARAVHSPEAILMAAATLASSVVVRGTPVASVAAGKRASARPMRGSALVVRAEGEIAGLSECGKFQELCKAEIPGKIPRCVTTDAPRGVPDRDVSRRLRASPRRRATRARRPANIRTFSDVSSRRSRSKDEAPSRWR
jgi:hypothetical protein